MNDLEDLYPHSCGICNDKKIITNPVSCEQYPCWRCDPNLPFDRYYSTKDDYQEKLNKDYEDDMQDILRQMDEQY